MINYLFVLNAFRRVTLQLTLGENKRSLEVLQYLVHLLSVSFMILIQLRFPLDILYRYIYMITW